MGAEAANTKSMLALPGRPYQYRAAGWIQEHWSLAPPHRGKGFHPGWVPFAEVAPLVGFEDGRLQYGAVVLLFPVGIVFPML